MKNKRGFGKTQHFLPKLILLKREYSMYLIYTSLLIGYAARHKKFLHLFIEYTIKVVEKVSITDQII